MADMQRVALKRSIPFKHSSRQDGASSSSISSEAGDRAAAAETELTVDEDEPVVRQPPMFASGGQGVGLPTPRAIFTLVSCLFWSTMLVTYLQYHFSSSSSNLRYDSLSAVPCNPSNRPLATCAHRANAAELLSLLQGSSRSSASSGASAAAGGRHLEQLQQLSLQEQMSALWSHGITCFDLDVVQLAGGDFVIGHPADLAHKASSSSSSSSSSSMVPELLHKHSLAELRAAGVDAAAAPALHAVLRHFAKLRRSKPPGGSKHKLNRSGSSSSSSSTAVEAALQRDSWQQVPLLALELKGPASADAEAWQDVAAAVQSAGVADSSVLWLRQPATSSSSSSSNRGSGVLQLAQSIRKNTRSGSSSRSRSSSGIRGPLLGLIVPDTLLPSVAQVSGAVRSSSSTAGSNAASLLRAATGLAMLSGHNSSSSGAAAVLEVFDVLAPSIRLPPASLAQLASWKPVLAWTLESDSDVHAAMWLGLDVVISNLPVQQAAYVTRSQAGVCNAPTRGA